MKMTARQRALDKIYKRRDRYEIPDWQREEVWTSAKRQKLIDSILRGWKLPKFYFLKTNDDPEEYEVVDGQQRLLAIFEFIDNELPLPSDSRGDFGGATYYEELPDHLSDRFDDFEIEYDEIEEVTEEDLKEFFQRLQEGLPLTSSEKLNSVHSQLRDFCRTLADHPFFPQKTKVSPRRYGYFDIVAKVATLEIEGLDAGLRYDEMKAVFESNREFSDDSAVASRMQEVLESVQLVFPEQDPRLRNRTIVQAVLTLLARMKNQERVQKRAADLRSFFDGFLDELARQVELGQEATDEDFITFQKTVNANVKSGAQTRQRILIRKLLAHDPGFADLFDPELVMGSGLPEEIDRLGRAIGEAVTRLNAQHAGQSGEDLIKSTNRTTEAFLRLRRPIANLDGYKQLIDDLYVIFHEGPRGRLDSPPESFRDVNVLRTELRHDVDHGKAGKVRKKREKAGSTFKKYAGTVSPQTVAPSSFPAVQASLLKRILDDVHNLTGPS